MWNCFYGDIFLLTRLRRFDKILCFDIWRIIEGYLVRTLTRTLKALADPNRLRILLALRGRSLCVCQMVALLELAPSTVSKHLAILDQAGFLEARKEGRRIFYRRAGPKAPVEARRLTVVVDRLASASSQTLQDQKRLAKLLRIPAEEFCKRYYVPKTAAVSSSSSRTHGTGGV